MNVKVITQADRVWQTRVRQHKATVVIFKGKEIIIWKPKRD